MTEKRFEIMVGGMVWDNHVDEDRQLSRDEVVDLLNELSDENEQLKHRIQKYYDTTNADGKQIISDLVDSFELDKIDTSWFNKGDVE